MKKLTLLLLLCGIALAEVPDKSLTGYPGGLYCTFYDENNRESGNVVVLWSQLTDVTYDSMTFTTKDGIVTLSHSSAQTWICRPYGRDTRSAKDVQ